MQLHVSCAWRIVGSTGILVGASDYGRAAAADTAEDAFARGTVGARLRDVGNAAVRQLLSDGGLDVTEVDVDAVGGLMIGLQGGLRIEVFPDAAPAPHDEVEFWRLFEPGAPHVVIGTDGVDYVA